MMSDLIFVLSDQNGDLVRHMSFQEKKIVCSPEYEPVGHDLVSEGVVVCLTAHVGTQAHPEPILEFEENQS